MTGLLRFLGDVAQFPAIAMRSALCDVLDWATGPRDELPADAATKAFEAQARSRMRPACWWGSP